MSSYEERREKFDEEKVDESDILPSEDKDIEKRDDDELFLAQQAQALHNSDQRALALARAANKEKGKGSLFTSSLAKLHKQIDLANAYSHGMGSSSQTSLPDEVLQLNKYPTLFRGDLLGYQLVGFKWLARKLFNGESVVLGDEMGLGKTVQILALLAWADDSSPGNTLIIVPKTTLGNWMNEIERFVPGLGSKAKEAGPIKNHPTKKRTPALLYYDETGGAAAREELRKKYIPNEAYSKNYVPGMPIFVTTYDVAVRDANVLSNVKWRLIILDEGHRLKNSGSKTRDLLSQYNPTRNNITSKVVDPQVRIVLTGTPVQNDVMELWSLLNFVMPRIFNDRVGFLEVYHCLGVGSGAGAEYFRDQEDKNSIVTKLHTLLHRYILRRTKREVHLNLPPKVECVIYAGLTDIQIRLTKALLSIGGRTVTSELQKMGWTERGDTEFKVSTNNAQMNNRKLCCHPYLFAEPPDAFIGGIDTEMIIQASGKMIVLDKMLRKLRKNGHKVVIFSQFKQMIRIIADYFTFVGKDVLGETRVMDGETSSEDRSKSIAEFQNDPENKIFAFLLSSKAGGIGINLCAADTVIFYDNDWNPKMDEQAQDRCHRIGQVRPVVVYRLVTEGASVERHMMLVASGKNSLGRLVLQEGLFMLEESRDDSTSSSSSQKASSASFSSSSFYSSTSSSSSASASSFSGGVPTSMMDFWLRQDTDPSLTSKGITDQELDIVLDRGRALQAGKSIGDDVEGVLLAGVEKEKNALTTSMSISSPSSSSASASALASSSTTTKLSSSQVETASTISGTKRIRDDSDDSVDVSPSASISISKSKSKGRKTVSDKSAPKSAPSSAVFDAQEKARADQKKWSDMATMALFTPVSSSGYEFKYTTAGRGLLPSLNASTFAFRENDEIEVDEKKDEEARIKLQELQVVASANAMAIEKRALETEKAEAEAAAALRKVGK
jgi:SNF2 family DNA or RNA helicase